jgi:hypothetical protein
MFKMRQEALLVTGVSAEKAAWIYLAAEVESVLLRDDIALHRIGKRRKLLPDGIELPLRLLHGALELRLAHE